MLSGQKWQIFLEDSDNLKMSSRYHLQVGFILVAVLRMSGIFAVVWSRGNRCCLGVGADDGVVYLAGDPASGRSVRLLDA